MLCIQLWSPSRYAPYLLYTHATTLRNRAPLARRRREKTARRRREKTARRRREKTARRRREKTVRRRGEKMSDAEKSIVRKDVEQQDAKLQDAYILSLLLESSRSGGTEHGDLLEELPRWLALHRRLQYNYLTTMLAGPTAVIKNWSLKEPVPYEPGDFDLFSYSDKWCINFLRFTKRQILEMCVLLDIPDRFEHGNRARPTTALSLVLYRLAWPKRLKDCMLVFGKERGWLSSVFNGTCQHLYHRFRDKLLWDNELLSPQALDRYCTVIQRKGEPSGRVWGFIDGTHRQICRPRPETAPQEKLYSAYKKFHSMEYVAIATPDGLLACLRGPYEGRASDWGIYKDGMDEILRRNAYDSDGECDGVPITEREEDNNNRENSINKLSNRYDDRIKRTLRLSLSQVEIRTWKEYV
jgi:hypothetical protein